MTTLRRAPPTKIPHSCHAGTPREGFANRYVGDEKSDGNGAERRHDSRPVDEGDPKIDGAGHLRPPNRGDLLRAESLELAYREWEEDRDQQDRPRHGHRDGVPGD